MKTAKLVQKVGSTLVCRGVSAFGTLALSVCLARLLSIEEFGRFYVDQTTIVLLAVVCRLGFDGALLKYGGVAWHARDHTQFNSVTRTALVTVGTASLLISICSQIVLILVDGDRTTYGMLAIQLLALLPVSVCYVVATSFKAAGFPELGGLFEVGSVSLLSCLLIVVWAASGSPISAAGSASVFVGCAWAVAALGTTLVFYLLMHRSSSQDSKAKPALSTNLRFAEYFSTATDFALITAAQFLGNWGGVLVLGAFHSRADAGVLSAALRVVQIPQLFLNIIVAIVSPRISGMHGSGDTAGMMQLANRSSGIVFLATFPIVALIAVGAPWIMAIFGDKFSNHWYFLTILAVGQFAGIVTGVSAPLLSMTGRHRLVRQIGIVTASIAVLLSFWLSLLIGSVGAAIAGAIYATGQAIAVAYAAWKICGYFPAATR